VTAAGKREVFGAAARVTGAGAGACWDGTGKDSELVLLPSWETLAAPHLRGEVSPP